MRISTDNLINYVSSKMELYGIYATILRFKSFIPLFQSVIQEPEKKPYLERVERSSVVVHKWRRKIQ